MNEARVQILNKEEIEALTIAEAEQYLTDLDQAYDLDTTLTELPKMTGCLLEDLVNSILWAEDHVRDQKMLEHLSEIRQHKTSA